MILCWSVKGGSGVTVVTVALALCLAEPTVGPERPVLLVDLVGDVVAALGVADPGGPGVIDWLAADPPPDDASLAALMLDLGTGVSVLPAGRSAAPLRHPADQHVATAGWARLAAFARRFDGAVVVDAGLGVPPAPLRAADVTSLLVVRPCYLALRRATAVASAATGVVVVMEPGRSLTRSDIESALRVPVVAEIPLDPAVGRAVDAGLLLGRVPSSLRRGIRSAV